jgi:alpha-ribazole phosphatase
LSRERAAHDLFRSPWSKHCKRWRATMAHHAIPLSDLGRQQAALIATTLDVKPTLLLSSTYLRAIETARPFSERTGCPITPRPLLHEFSALDVALLEGMTVERRPVADAFWAKADPDPRHGPGSETFREFGARVAGFAGNLPHLPQDTVFFGHGIWFALLCWKLWGFNADDATVMRECRRFQRALPMPNCPVYGLEQVAKGRGGFRPLRRSRKRSPLRQPRNVARASLTISPLVRTRRPASAWRSAPAR